MFDRHEEAFAARTEALARAMCAALDIDPDKTFSHGADYSPRPIIRQGGGAIPAILLHSPNWVSFGWQAEKWIYEHSGGQLPEPLKTDTQ